MLVGIIEEFDDKIIIKNRKGIFKFFDIKFLDFFLIIIKCIVTIHEWYHCFVKMSRLTCIHLNIISKRNIIKHILMHLISQIHQILKQLRLLRQLRMILKMIHYLLCILLKHFEFDPLGYRMPSEMEIGALWIRLFCPVI